MSKEEKREKVNPIRLIDKETDESYILDFDLESIKFADRQGLDPDLVLKFPATQGELLFYCAFRKNHRNVAREKTNKILWEYLGGFNETTGKVFARLIELYYSALGTLSVEEQENPRVAVEL